MAENKRQIHPIWEGRSVMTAEQYAEMQTGYEDRLITTFFNEQMAIVRQTVSGILAQRQLSDSYAAQMIGYDKTQYSKWMNEPNRNLSPSTIVPMSNLLGCSANEFVVGEKRPIALPKLEALIYSIIRKRAAWHADCDKLISSYTAKELPYQELICERIMDRADDMNVNPYLLLTEKSVEMKQIAEKMVETHQFVGRLPLLYGVCMFLKDSADYYLRQNYAPCEMTADGKPVEEKYKQTIGAFAALSKKEKHEITAKMVLARYM